MSARARLPVAVHPPAEAAPPVPARSIGVGWAAATRVTGAAAALASTALLGRLLDAADFGAVALVTSLATAGGFVGSAGLNRLLLREAARATGDETATIGDPTGARFGEVLRAAPRVLALALPGAALLTAGAVALLVPAAAASPALWVIGAMLAVVTAVLLVESDLLRGLGELRWSNGTSGRSGGVVVLGALTALLLVVQPRTATGALACVLAASIAAALSLAVPFGRFRADLRRAARLFGPGDGRDVRIRSTVAASAAFAGIQLVLLAGAQVDLWVAGGVLDDADVGAYAAAARTMALVTVPLVTVQLASQATVAHLTARGERSRLQRQVRRLAAGAVVPSTILLAACVLAPALVLRLVLGPGYSDGAPVLAVLALGQAVNVGTGLCGTVLSMGGEERLVLAVSAAGAVASALAGLVGAALAGPVGLAVAASVTTAATFMSLWWCCRTRLGIRTEPGWTRAAAGTS